MAINLRRAIARRIDRGFFEGVEKEDGLWAGQFRAYGVDGVAFDARDEDDSTPNRIVGVADPIGDYDAANKKYVDALHQGLVWKEPVRVAHDTLKVASPGSTIDGVSMVVGDRVLRMSQSGHEDNGIWIWKGASVPMVRAPDADGSDPDGKSELRSGTLVPVQEGTKYGDTVWWLVSPDTPVVIGTTPTEWRQFKSAGDLTAGSYIQISGNEISVRVGAGLTSSGGNLVPNFTASGSDNGTSTAVARGDHKHDSLYKDIGWVPSWDNVTNKPQGLVNLAAKAAESGTSGFLKKTGQNTWTLDATTYATASALSSHTNASNPHSGSAPLNSPVFAGTPELPTTTKLGTSVLQTLINGKAAVGHTHSIVAGDGLHGGGSVGQSAITLHVDLATDSGLEFTSTDKKLKVLFGGSGGDHGSSDTVARSNHDHSLVKGLKSGFEIAGIATSTKVTANNLSLLTDNGVGDGGIDYISDMHQHACQIVYVGVAAESITYGDPVFLNPHGEVRRSAAQEESRGYVVGIALGNYPTDAHVYAAVAGFVNDVGDLGENFLGEDGGLSPAPPPDPDHRVIRVGMGVPGGLVIQINDFGA